MKRWIRNLILRWLGIADHQQRLLDVERHFVIKRDETGAVTETLADVPIEKRKELRARKHARNWPQYQRYLEATDGGRRAAVPERMESIS